MDRDRKWASPAKGSSTTLGRTSDSSVSATRRIIEMKSLQLIYSILSDHCARTIVCIPPKTSNNPLPLTYTDESSVQTFHRHQISSNNTESSLSRDASPEFIHPKEIYILLLGQTGTGKSTFINAFANYLRYNSLDEALKQSDVEPVIPSEFTVTDSNFEQKLVKVGDCSDCNENFTHGQSSTQKCKSHTFTTSQGQAVTLIDTPGIGDTRGIEKDKKNLQNILEHISSYDNINGVCILLKPNNARLDTTFVFCVSEVLRQLHKDASENIVFCFTNTRSTFYRPGDTLAPLKYLIEEMLPKSSNRKLSLNKSTVYCFDSESFRLLAAAVKGNVKFEEDEIRDYSKSWDHSSCETKRLLLHISSCIPHHTQGTRSLNEVRNVLAKLCKPIVDLTVNIDKNVAHLREKKQEVSLIHRDILDEEGNLYIERTNIKVTRLDHPRTVCTNNTCCIIVPGPFGEVKQNHFKKHCHRRCYLEDVESDTINNPKLMHCSAMNGSENCTICGCHWRSHMHTFSHTEEETVEEVDETVEEIIRSKMDKQNKVERVCKRLDKLIQELTDEKRTVTNYAVQIVQFIKHNSLVAFNDATPDYIKMIIKTEREKGNYEKVRRLEETLRQYNEEHRLYDELASGAGGVGSAEGEMMMSVERIEEMMRELGNLKHCGTCLKDFLSSF